MQFDISESRNIAKRAVPEGIEISGKNRVVGAYFACPDLLLQACDELEKLNFNANLNAALIFLDRALEEIENGFIPCATCGDQEDTKNLDFVDDLKLAKEEIIKTIK